MPYKLKDSVRHKFKKQSYNKRDWKAYDEGLKNRGSLIIWFSGDAIASWNHPGDKKRKRGRQKEYSDLAIETAHTLRLVYKQGLRQTEGLMLSIINLLGIDLTIPDYSTLSRRAGVIPMKRKPLNSNVPVTIIVDSTGLKVVGEKEWMNHKHGTKQQKVWRKLHLAITADGEILSSTLTNHTDSDTSQVDALLKEIDTPIDELIGDGGYDHPPTYQALDQQQKYHHQQHFIQAIIFPNTRFHPEKKTDSLQRLHNIRFIEDKGKLSWQNHMDYGRRVRVENTIFRYKAIIGNKLRSKTFENQNTETKIAVQILNRMAQLGMPRARKAT